MAALDEFSDSDDDITPPPHPQNIVPETPPAPRRSNVFSSSSEDEEDDDFLDEVLAMQVTPPPAPIRRRPPPAPIRRRPPPAPGRRPPRRRGRIRGQPITRMDIGDIIYIIRNQRPNELEIALGYTDFANASTFEGHSLLHHACIENKLEMCRVLIRAGADVNAQDEFNRTPLMEQIASGNINIEIIKLLLASGANVNLIDADGHSALYFAIIFENEAVIRYLIDNGANVKEVDILDAATRTGSEQLLELLLSKGADVNQKNREDKTPLYIAVVENKHGACKLLRKHGAGAVFEKDIFLTISLENYMSLETDSDNVRYSYQQTDGETKNDIIHFDYRTYNPLSLEYETITSPPWVFNSALEDPQPLKRVYAWVEAASNDPHGKTIESVQ